MSRKIGKILRIVQFSSWGEVQKIEGPKKFGQKRAKKILLRIVYYSKVN